MQSRRDLGASEGGRAIELTIHDVERGAGADGFVPVTLQTSRGEIALRYYELLGADRGAVFVGGAGGGWDTPGRGRLFPDLCADMANSGIAAVRVRFRRPAVLEQAALDVLAALHFLRGEGIASAAVVGHSFGGAVVAQAAAHAGDIIAVHAVVALSTQSYGVDALGELPARCAALIIHGTDDEVLPPTCSRYAYELAHEPKRLRLHAGTRHGLDEAADEIRDEVRDWIVEHLGRAGGG
jgi:pimeloyl-ACP methyl ester carboxylesterase